MTTEYDELLARLDGESADYRGDWSSVSEAVDAIRALTAQVVERDAVIEQARDLRANAGLQHLSPLAKDILDAILSQAPRDALAARDKTVRATALRDAADSYTADGYVTGEHTQGFFGIGDWEGEPDVWLRDRADQEEAQR